MWAGILTIAIGTALIAVIIWAVLHGDATVRAHRPAPPAPAGPPIETLAVDLRRLRTATQTPAPGASRVRRVATLAAYDDALAQACLALDLPDTLSALRPGPDREADRLRVEAQLEAAGLRFTSAQ